MKNYKKRLVKFDMFMVDTRTGKNGFYPGDIIHNKNNPVYPHILVLGVNENDSLVFAFCGSMMWHESGIHTDNLGCYREWAKPFARHGQKLIDNGEMRQI